MTHRSILAGWAPNIIIKAGASVTVTGHDSDRLAAQTRGKGSLSLERRRRTELARARAAIGDRVLFDLHLSIPPGKGKEDLDQVIEVQITDSGVVLVPYASSLKVYAGKDIDVQGIRGLLDAYAGYRLDMREVESLGHASAGYTMNLDCRSIAPDKVELTAGSDLRFYIHDLYSAYIRVKDIGGYWEARIGSGEKSIYLKSGGDVTLVTDQRVEPLPPNYIFGNIEKPGSLSLNA